MNLFFPTSLTSKHHLTVLVSGGLDSMVLLNELYLLQKKIKFKLSAIHFNFKLRGAESERDARFVGTFCKKLGVAYKVVYAPISSLSAVQERARNIRYQYLEKQPGRLGLNWFCTAHHADDVLETFLMRCMRGTGLTGLQAIPPARQLHSQAWIVRPLVKVFRKDLERYAKKEGLRFVEDSSNNENKYLRNKVRHYLIPELGHKKIKKSMPDWTFFFAWQSSVIEARLNDLKLRYTQGLPIPLYRRLPASLRFEWIRRHLKEMGWEKEFLASHFKQVENALGESGKGASLGVFRAGNKKGKIAFWQANLQGISRK